MRPGAILAVMALLLPIRGLAQEDDFTAMDLQELMSLEVVQLDALGIHTHLAGQWMVRHSYGRMQMDGNRIGRESMSVDAVLEDYMVAPLSMTGEMHHLEVMYALSNELTFMVMLPYHRREMTHRTRMGALFTTSSQGWGDLMVGAHWTVFGDVTRDARRVIFAGMLSLPTGSIGQTDETPAGPDQPLPYPMQFATGTIRVRPVIAYVQESGSLSWKVSTESTIGLSRNSRDYRTGNVIAFEAWGGWAPTRRWSLSGRIRGESRGDVLGADAELNPAMVPTADPALLGGRAIEIGPGATYYWPTGTLKGLRLSADLAVPVFQSLDGPQLEREWRVRGGVSWTR